MKTRLIAAAVTLSMAGMASAEDYTTWFQMDQSDESLPWRESSFTLQNWKDPQSGNLTVVTAGNKYYVPAGYMIHTMPSATEFAGDSLAVAGTIYCTIPGGTVQPFKELRLLPGGRFQHSSRNYMKAEPLVVEGTVANPALLDMYQAAGNLTQYLGTWQGGPDAAIRIMHRRIVGIPRETVISQQKALFADLSGYLGLLTVGQECCVLLNCNASKEYPGSIEVETNAVLSTQLYSGSFTVGGLKLNPGAELMLYCAYGTGSFTPYNVTNRFEASGNFRAGMDGWPAKPYLSDCVPVPFIHLTGPAAQTAADVSGAECFGITKTGPLPRRTWLGIEDVADGKDVCFKFDPVVRMMVNNGSNGSSKQAFDTANGSFWSTGVTPTADFEGDAVVDQGLALGLNAWQNLSFPKMMLTVDGGSIYHQAATFEVAELNLVAGTTIYTYNNATRPTLKGRIVLYPGSSPVTFSGWSGRTHVVEGELAGSGDLRLYGYQTTSIALELKGTNTAFSGGITVTSTADQYVEGSVDVCSTLYIHDGRNLGGAYSGTNAWKALTMENHTKLEALDDVTLDEPSRGVYVKNAARFIVSDGRVLDVREPVTYEGTLTKLGGGTLVLGGAARFFNGGTEPVDQPVVGSNVLSVAEGSLSVAATNAIDGLAVSLAAGVTLVVDPAATGDLAAYGGVSLKTGSSISYAGGSIPVAFKEGFAMPDEKRVSVAICTVSAVVAQNLSFTLPTRYARHPVVPATRQNADGSVTFLAEIKPIRGFVYSLR